MGDSVLAKQVMSAVFAALVGIMLYLIDVISGYQGFPLWQVALLTIFSGVGMYEHLLGNRIWATLVLIVAILVLLAPALAYYA